MIGVKIIISNRKFAYLQIYYLLFFFFLASNQRFATKEPIINFDELQQQFFCCLLTFAPVQPSLSLTLEKSF
jgi:hypothetical protein